MKMESMGINEESTWRVLAKENFCDLDENREGPKIDKQILHELE
jgi:hypothetical protein